MVELHTLPEKPDAYPDELALLRGLQHMLTELGSDGPSAALGEWWDRYLLVVFHDARSEGDEIRLLYGDGYTQIDGPGIAYEGYMPPEEALPVVRELLSGPSSETPSP